MKVIRRSESPRQLTQSRPATHRELYFFYERNTGVAHFHVEAEADGRLPVDQAAGMLAMHCMVRGQSPSDYIVMVQTDDTMLEDLVEKTTKLLQAGHSVTAPVRLTRREEEVLAGVMKSLANKEIAAHLNLSERTVKFHVSSLLAKFRVRGRMELVREATKVTATPLPMARPAAATRETRVYSPRNTAQQAVLARESVVVPLTKPRLMA